MSTFFRLVLLKALLLAALPVLAQSQAIARHARQAPDSLRHNLPQLVDYLLEPAGNEREKAYSLYAWVVHNITYDGEAGSQGRRINQSLSDILRRGSGTCFDYSLLYAALCRQAGLLCMPVSGYARQGLGALEVPPVPDHSWNAVFLDGQWHLLDATWGAAPGQDALMAEYSTGYFLTPPRLFLLNHLPAMPMWQLLPCPVSPEEYSRPAETLLPLADERGPCFDFADTIRAFLRLPPEEQRLAEAEAAYRFHPTAGNRAAWAQAITDYAVGLSEQAERLLQQDSLKAFLQRQQEAIFRCRQARALAPPLPWQTELFAGLLANRAVALNQLSDEVDSAGEELALLREARKCLEEAQEALRTLPEDNYYRQYAEQQCAAYLEAVMHNIGRLE
ncbi:MAG: hypothetical protein H6559_04235 [Lewinellaceae bacterium]|nr:hypothetical protein [Lewinellaceae bacterium]